MRQAQIKKLKPLKYTGNEAINTICSNLTFSGRDLKKIALTSCNASEGKSFLSMQIAYTMAKRGKRVILIDADLRRSVTISHFGIISDGDIKGLAHYLAGHNELDDVIFETNVNNLFIIPAGRDIANPVPLLLSQTFTGLLENLNRQYDMIIVDTPPIGLVIDAAEIAKCCDGVVLVAKYKSTHRREMIESKQQIEQTGTQIIGCIINDVTFDSISTKKYYGKSYYSHYGYYRREKKKKSTGKV